MSIVTLTHLNGNVNVHVSVDIQGTAVLNMWWQLAVLSMATREDEPACAAENKQPQRFKTWCVHSCTAMSCSRACTLQNTKVYI